MGTPLGFFSDDGPEDYPELNKCPDCETFFAELNCPLCGRECPESMRAGNRVRVKEKKTKRYTRRQNGRVQFVPWYLSTWFIILMLFVQPIIGLVLMWVGDWRKPAKIILTVLFVLYFVGGFFLGGILQIFHFLFYREEIPVNLEISYEEYVELCKPADPEALFRQSANYPEPYVFMTVTVDGVWENYEDYESDYSLYIQCHVEEDGKQWTFLLRDYRQGDKINLTKGDVITFYGQPSGNVTLTNQVVEMSAPGINVLYITLETE